MGYLFRITILSIRSFFEKMFCKHDYEEIFYYEEYNKAINLRFSSRIYQCTKCGKKIEVDGRHDPYAN